MEKCARCENVEVKPPYKFCYPCSQEMKNDKEMNKDVEHKEVSSKGGVEKELNEIKDILLKSNWNFGIKSLTGRLRLMVEVADKVGDKELIKEIYESLKETYKKDLRNLKGIKKEQENEKK